MTFDIAQLSSVIDAARGNCKSDLVIKNTGIFNLTDGTITNGDIAVKNGIIVGVGEEYDGIVEIDGGKLCAVPGFFDAHVHIESSMVTPFEFERCVLPHGVTSAICDPHELANVAGCEALDYFLECAARMVMDLRIQISSCVPATHLETSGAELNAEILRRYAGHPLSSGLAEMMNVPGVLFKVPDVLAKICAFQGRIDGHAPLLTGKDLNACLAAGIRNCHETCSLAEGAEKLRKGMQLLIREGSVGRNLDELTPLITVANSPFLGFCTDDRNPLDIAESGHLDGIIARAIELGADPLAVYRTACLSPALHFNFHDRGLIAPGKIADIVLLDDLRTCKVNQVFKRGCAVNEELFSRRSPAPDSAQFHSGIRRDTVSAADFRIAADTTAAATTPVIGIIELSLLTDRLECRLPEKNGEKLPDPAQDIAKIAVLERHGKNGNTGLGFVKGFGLRHGAIASSVGHDSHNLCVVGSNDSDMALAANTLIATQGGFCAVRDGKVLSSMVLPVGGLMSAHTFEEVAVELRDLHAAAAKTDCPLETPFLQLAFLALPVIPHLRLTDRGLVDVDKFELI